MTETIETRITELQKEYKQAQEQATQWLTRVTEIKGALIELNKLLTSSKESTESNAPLTKDA